MKDDAANQTQHGEYVPTYEYELDKPEVIHDHDDFTKTLRLRLLLFLPFLPFLYVWVAAKKLVKCIERFVKKSRNT